MIALTQLASTIESGLNNNEQGIKFRIFSDEGTFKKALKSHTEKVRYTNGVIRAGTSAVIPAAGITVATQSAVLEVVAQLISEETDDEVIAAHRAALDAFFSQFTVQRIDVDGKSFTVSIVYSLADTGTIQLRPPISSSFTFYVNINMAYIENGLNSDDVTYTLDGLEIPSSTVRVSRNPTIESNISAGSDGRSTGRESAFVRGWDFEMPALYRKPISDLVFEELYGNGLNDPHTLVQTCGGKSNTYTVIFGSVFCNIEGIQNAGLAFSLVEAAPYI